MVHKTDTKKILVVDDDSVNLNILFSCIKASGYIVRLAKSGKSALKLLSKFKPDLILLDIMMPDIDGYETCKIIKQDNHLKDIPIIFITGLTNTDDKVKGFELGAIDYIVKPFQKTEVMARISIHLTLESQKKELASLNEKLSESNKLKDKLFSIVAVDMSNAFINMQSFFEAIAQSSNTFSKEDIVNYASEMSDIADKTFKKMENIIYWARIQRNKIDFSSEKIDMAAKIPTFLRVFHRQAEQKGIELQINIEPDTFGICDPNMLDVVLRNMVSNAIKFSNKGDKVNVNASNNEDKCVIVISDSGIGISEEKLSKLFSINVRHKDVGTGGEKGTGVGLVLCKELIDKNNGTINVESEAGKGTVFKILLPVSL